MTINSSYPSIPGTVRTTPSTVIKRHLAAGEPTAVQPGDAGEKTLGKDEADAVEQSSEPLMTETEKQYFAAMFPAASADLRTYSPYQRNGARQSAGLGALVDVKG